MSSPLWRPLLRGTLGGLAGTIAMTCGYSIEGHLRRQVRGALDYDDSLVPALAAARVLGWPEPDAKTQRGLGLLVHWGYGSLVGVAAVPLADRFPETEATLWWWSAITMMAAVLFPSLGRTPPPWRWKKDVLLTSLTQHLIYAVVVIHSLQRIDPQS